jgi:hypothetical protein
MIRISIIGQACQKCKRFVDRANQKIHACTPYAAGIKKGPPKRAQAG